MSRIIYVNGQYRPYASANIPVEDRGFQWGDSVYVVFAYHQGRFIDIDHHLERLQSYAGAIQFQLPFEPAVFRSICKELIRANHLQDASVYVQLTRGVARRVHWFPTEGCTPSVIIIARPFRFNFCAENIEKITVITSPDIRWRYSSIKTNAALANVLLRQSAVAQQSFENWLLDPQNCITEGASSNAFIINKDGSLQTRPDDGTIVAGVTRDRILELAQANGIKVNENAFTLEDAYQAAEAFITGATSLIKSVTKINQVNINDGHVGPVTRKIANLYYNYCTK